MHDATEGGVKRGVWEVAQASKRSLSSTVTLPPGHKNNVCGFFNPSVKSLSEGARCSPLSQRQKALGRRSPGKGIESAVIRASWNRRRRDLPKRAFATYSSTRRSVQGSILQRREILKNFAHPG